jgi:hypothetical protein
MEVDWSATEEVKETSDGALLMADDIINGSRDRQ